MVHKIWGQYSLEFWGYKILLRLEKFSSLAENALWINARKFKEVEIDHKGMQSDMRSNNSFIQVIQDIHNIVSYSERLHSASQTVTQHQELSKLWFYAGRGSQCKSFALRVTNTYWNVLCDINVFWSEGKLTWKFVIWPF